MKYPPLTDREEELMQLLWKHGAKPVRELVELYPDPKPHFNTVSTNIRNLEAKGYVTHTAEHGAFRYAPVAPIEEIRSRSLSSVIRGYFSGNYLGAVSSLVEEEKISVDELRELIDLVEKKQPKP